MQTALVDWRGHGRWTYADRQRTCDIASVWQSHTKNPLPNAGKTLVAFSALLYSSGIEGVYAEPWNTLPVIKQSNGDTPRVWDSGNGPYTVAVDLARLGTDRTRRGSTSIWAGQVANRYPWADGLHLDYYTDLAWLWPDLDYDWSRYLQGLRMLIGAIKAVRPDWTIIGQNFHFPGGEPGQIDGLFLEVNPTMFGKTMADHSKLLAAHRDIRKLSGLEPTTWICELREPSRYSEWYRQEVAAWCEWEGIALAWGRDASALVGVPG